METGKRRRKLGELVAERIVAEIIRNGWHEGDVLGTEQDFLERFRVSRATFREAVRQLEWQGIAAMRRGVNGGLVVSGLPRHATIFSIQTYFRLAKVSSIDREEVAFILKGARSASNHGQINQAVDLFSEALEDRTMRDLSRAGGSGEAAPKLSEIVALRIVQEIESAGTSQGGNLGNAQELQKRFGASRAVLREALRQLELHDIIRVKTGQQGGIFVHSVDPGHTVELASTFLAYARIPASHIWEVNSRLAAASIHKFARRANPAAIERLRRAFDRLNQAPATHYLVSASEFHIQMADGCGNRALALFMRILLHHNPKILPKPDPRFLPEIKAEHGQMLAAIEDRRFAEAEQIMAGLFQHSRRWIQRAEARQQPRQPAPSGTRMGLADRV